MNHTPRCCFKDVFQLLKRGILMDSGLRNARDFMYGYFYL